jgi:tetratricopeptide (TPR) repeat protein
VVRLTRIPLFMLAALALAGSARAQDPQREFGRALALAQAARQRDDMPTYERLLRYASTVGELNEGNLRALSWCIRRQGRPEHALEVAQINFQRYPGRESCAELASCYADLGDFAAARSCVRRILEAVPGSASHPLVKPLYDRLATRTYQFTWNVDLEAQKKYQRKGPILLPVPFESRPYQTAKTTVRGGSAQFVTRGENQFLEVDRRSTGPLTITSTVTLTPLSYRREAKAAGWSFPESARPYTQKSANVDPDDPAVAPLAQRLRAPGYYQTVLNIMRWVNDHVNHNTNGPSGGSTAEIFRRGGGHCEARAAAGIALMRACGIPARFVRGNAFILEKNDISWHTVTEYYLPGTGWVTWDYRTTPLESMSLGYIATFSYGNSFDGPVYGEKGLEGPWAFQMQGLKCEFITGRLLSRSLL